MPRSWDCGGPCPYCTKRAYVNSSFTSHLKIALLVANNDSYVIVSCLCSSSSLGSKVFVVCFKLKQVVDFLLLVYMFLY